MALTDTKVPNASADVVAVFRQDTYAQVFEKARPVKATIRETSKVMEHPVENGTVITDHRIVNPIEIDLSVVIAAEDYRDVYQAVRQLFTDATFLVVQTRTATYQRLIISAMPHEEDPAMFDAVGIAVGMKEVIVVSAQYGQLSAGQVKNAPNASTVKTGEQQGTETNDTSGSLLYKAFK